MARWSKKIAALGAGATQANVLAGQIGNPPTRPSAILVRATASVAGVLATLIVGSRIIISDQELSAANRFPVNGQDEIMTPDAAMPGEMISLTFRNSGAAAADIFYSIDAPELTR